MNSHPVGSELLLCLWTMPHSDFYPDSLLWFLQCKNQWRLHTLLSCVHHNLLCCKHLQLLIGSEYKWNNLVFAFHKTFLYWKILTCMIKVKVVLKSFHNNVFFFYCYLSENISMTIVKSSWEKNSHWPSRRTKHLFKPRFSSWLLFTDRLTFDISSHIFSYLVMCHRQIPVFEQEEVWHQLRSHCSINRRPPVVRSPKKRSVDLSE